MCLLLAIIAAVVVELCVKLHQAVVKPGIERLIRRAKDAFEKKKTTNIKIQCIPKKYI